MEKLTLAIQMLIVAIVFAVVLGAIFVLPSDPVEDIEITSESENIPRPAEIDHDETTAVAGYGDAIHLSGGDDRVSLSNVDLGDSWALCTWARATDAAESRMIAGDGEVSIFYDAAADEFGIWRYNSSSRNSYAVGVAADDALSWTLVCGQRDGDELSVSANLSVESTTMEGDEQADMPANEHWYGDIDETRVFDAPLNTSQRQEWVDNPTLSTETTVPELRVRYDLVEDGDETAPVYFNDAEATLHGHSMTAGLTPPEISEPEDYELANDSSEITITEDGVLTTGDVVFIEFSTRSSTARTIAQLAMGIGLLVIISIPILKLLGDD